MKINDEDVYKIKAITKTKRYLDWESDFKQKYEITLPPNRDVLLDAKEEQLVSMHFSVKNRNKKDYEKEAQYYYTNDSLLWYLNKNPQMSKDIELLLNEFNLACSQKVVILVLYYVLFGEYTPPFFGLISLESGENDEIKLVIDKNISKDDWMVVWDLLHTKMAGAEGFNGYLDTLSTREKEWKTFDRDLAIYLLYGKLKNNPDKIKQLNKNNLTSNSIESKSVYYALIDSPEYQEIKKLYKIDETMDDEKLVSSAITFCNKVLKDLPLI